MQEHKAISVEPVEGVVVCLCGALCSIGRLDHFRIHGCEPHISELETMWRRAISWHGTRVADA